MFNATDNFYKKLFVFLIVFVMLATALYGTTGQQSFEMVSSYTGYDGYVWNGTARTNTKASNYVALSGDALESTVGIEESPMSDNFTGAYLSLSTAKVALMSYYLPTNEYDLPSSWYTNAYKIESFGTTGYSGGLLKTLTVCTDAAGILYIGTATVHDVYKARINGTTDYPVYNMRSFKVIKGLNLIIVNLFVSEDSTVVLGGNGSVGLYYAKGINVNDHNGDFAYLDGTAHSDVFSTTSSVKDKLCIKAVLGDGAKPVIDNVRSTYTDNLADYETNVRGSYTYYYPETLAGKTLKYIEIPVKKVDQIDANQTFTLTVCDKDSAINQSNVNGTAYTIKLPLSQLSGCKTYAVNKWIMVDLSSYNITVSSSQVLVFGKTTDTVEWAWCASHNLCKLETFYVANTQGTAMTPHVHFDTTYYTYIPNYSYNHNLMFNIYVADGTGTNRITNLKNDFKLIDVLYGKQMSLIGDSISTFEGVNNNTAINSTIGGNAVFYHGRKKYNSAYDSDSAFVIDKPADTWWGRTADKTGMKLCVNGAWSGSATVDENNKGYACACNSIRPYNLHRNVGTTVNPDVILVYMGTNDCIRNPISSNYFAPGNPNSINWTNIETLATNQTSGSATANKSLNFAEAYALMIAKMRKAYPNAKIFCMTVLKHGLASGNGETEQVIIDHNNAIKGVANHYSLPIIDLYTTANSGSYKKWTDGLYDSEYYSIRDWLHPNEEGMAIMSNIVISGLTSYYVG